MSISNIILRFLTLLPARHIYYLGDIIIFIKDVFRLSNLRYYVIGNTAEGQVNHLDTNLIGIDQVVALHHPSARLKTAVLQKLMDHYANHNIEVLESSLGNDVLDGIIIREKAIAFLDERIARQLASTDVHDLNNFSHPRERPGRMLVDSCSRRMIRLLKVCGYMTTWKLFTLTRWILSERMNLRKILSLSC